MARSWIRNLFRLPAPLQQQPIPPPPPSNAEDHRRRHFQNVSALDPVLRQKAVEFLRRELVVCSYRPIIVADPQLWWASGHFYQGMAIRNRLREHGFGETEFHVGNLDDYYVALIELAIMGDHYFDDLAKMTQS